MELQALVDRLQVRVDKYKQLLEREEGLVVQFNAYPVPERLKDEAHAIRVQYNEVNYQRKLAGIAMYGSKMDLFDVTGADDQQWPPHLRQHHPKNCSKSQQLRPHSVI